ncbi:MAG TPA: hypothetical protein PKY59_24020 [Pyrinomonadaceae bacterium]|nr:hypothetical protein [Pyrinomonadaceae bacterium]
MKAVRFFSLLMSVSLLTSPTFTFAQSGKKIEQPALVVEAVTPPKTQETNKPATQFVLANDFSRYIEELNKLGKLNYRVEKAFNYGGDAANAQKFAAVVRLDEGTYEYDWMTSPNKNFIETRLNAKAEQGFSVVQILPLSSCLDGIIIDSDRSAIPTVNETLLRLTKGDVFLLERQSNKTVKTKEYKVIIGKIGIGKSPTTEIQTALDNVSEGFQPIKILFNKSGTFDFSVSVLLEKDLRNDNAEKIQYRFLKDVNGFEKEINTLAKDGFQLIGGRRIGLMKFALLAKVSGNAVSYILLDTDKYQKEIAKKVTPANFYKGMFLGDTSCDEPETKGGKLVFAETADANQTFEYKFVKLSDKNQFPTDGDSVAELNKLLAQKYTVRDIFYSDGAILILEK